jgi:hypothetical protein
MACDTASITMRWCIDNVCHWYYPGSTHVLYYIM